MKKIFVFLVAISFITFLSAQSTIVFHEDFELPSLGDSLQSSTDPIGGNSWAISTHLKNSGLRADSNRVQIGKTVYLTTNSFSTVGYSNVYLKFAQICKLFFSDGGQVEVSINGGLTWSLLSSSYYQGTASMVLNRFSESSYSIWRVGDTVVNPTNDWWKNETFNISSLASNQANVKIRFKYTGSNNPLGAGRYGWLLDDIKVIASMSELDPPTLNVVSYPADTAYYGGPYNVSAYVKDASGIDTVYISYKVGNGNFTQLGMVKSPIIDSLYTAGIPFVGYGKKIVFKITAIDASSAHNFTEKPLSDYYSFFIKYSTGGNVIVGSGSSPQNYPFKSNADSTKSAALYLYSNINRYGYINQLQWYVSTAQASLNIPIRIYIKQSNASALIGDSWASLMDGAVLVYNGTQTFASTGWKTIALNTPYNYNSGNLIVLCETNYGGLGAVSTPSFRFTNASSGSHQFFASSSSIVDVNAQRPNITLGFAVVPSLTQDAGISQLTSPVGSVTAGTVFDIVAKIKNFGSSVLTKTNVSFALDGNIQSTSLWTGSLLKDSSISYTVGNLNTTIGMHTLKVWTNLPNDSIDQNNINDTAFYTFYSCGGPLNGNYSVGGPNANFQTFADVNIGLTQCGINGPVVFNINPGTYSEQITLNEIVGASSSNTITFQSLTNDSTSVILNHASTSTSNWIVKLNSSDYISFKNIKFAPADSLYSVAIVLINGATNNKFIGNLFLGFAGAATSQSLINIEGSVNANHGNLIQKNHIIKGSYGISVKGIANVRLKNIIIKNNIIDNSIVYGIYTQYVDSLLIDSNTISSSLYNTNKYGIYLQSGNVNCKITKNTVNLKSGVNMYGIFAESSVSTDLSKGLIANNFVSIVNGSTIAYGIRLNSLSKYNVFANSVACFGNSSTNTRAINITSSCSGIDLKNNNLLSNKYPFYVEGNSSVSSCDFNNYYSTGINLVNWNAVEYMNLSSFTASSLMDSNSVSYNPYFFSFTDLHTFNGLLKGKGVMLADITTDIDGDMRLNPPCIGADEFLPPSNDATLVAIKNPTSGCGLTSIEAVTIVIKNVGVNTMLTGNYEVAYKIVGSNPVNPEIIYRTIAPGDTIHYTFNAKVNLSVATTHIDSVFNLLAWINLSADYAKSNDTTSLTILSSYLPSIPLIGPNVTIPYATTALLTASSTDLLQWYNVPVGGNAIGSGNQFTTPVLLDTTTFYVHARANETRINYALTADVSQGSGGGYGYTPDLYNDGIIPAYGTSGPGIAGWVSTNSWIEFEWNHLVSLRKVVFYKDIKPMTTCTFQYWDGAAFVDFYSYNNGAINDSVTFPLITTTKIRFNNISGILANPNFREIEVYSGDGNNDAGCASVRVPITVYTVVSPHEAGISNIITPTGCALYQVPVSIKLFNHGNTPLNPSNTTISYKVDNGNFITPEALNIIIPPFDTAQYTFSTLANFAAPTADRYIKITAIVNTQSDAMHSNDTLIKDSIVSQFTPPSPTSTNVNVNNGNSVTLIANAQSGSVLWFDQPVGGNKVWQGAAYITPVLYATDTFYIEAKAFNTYTATIGAGTSTNTAYSFPSPYGIRFAGAKHQILITKSEMNANGLQAGPIYSLAFDVAAIGSTSGLNNLSIKMGHTNLNALAVGNWVANTVNVYSTGLYAYVQGWNTHTFTTPFIWNGNDNVVAEICFDNEIQPNNDNNPLIRNTPTTFNSVVLTYYSSLGVCNSIASTEIYMNRPNMKIMGTIPGCSSSPRVPVIANVSLPPQNDAGIIALANPIVTTLSGVSTPIKVKIKNYGQAALTNVKVAWKLNNVLQPIYNFTGNIAPGSDSIVTIANETFNGGYYCIKSWTFLPNNIIDSVSANDTLFNTCFNACLNGNYTIGSNLGNNYPSFNSAVASLIVSGVCGNVTFLVDSGTYNEQVRIPEIYGASASSTITFRSAANDSTKVILQYNSSSDNNSYTLKLDSADYIRIEKMTIKVLNGTYGNGIELNNGARNNIISNNRIEIPDNSSPYYTGILDPSYADTYNKFQNNLILNGYYGLNSSGGKKGTEIRGNKLINFKYYGIYSVGNDSVMITGNELISNGLIGNATYALYSSSCNNAFQITKNKITLTSPGHQFGLYLYNNNGTASAHGLIANNMISLSGGASNSSNYGLYPTSSSYLDFYHNSVNVAVPSLINGRSFFMWQSSNISLKNNIFVNTGGGYAYYVQTPAAVAQSEYNNIYTSGSIIGYWNTDQPTLLDLQTASTKNANSVSLNPSFVSITDLHLATTALSALGTPVSSVTDDIDGKIRNSLHPCIGAHEIPLLQHDAGVSFIASPNDFETEGSSVPVKVAVKNYGTSPITSMTVSYVINNGSPVIYAYNGNIPYLGVDTVIFPVNFTAVAGNNNLCAYTTLTGDSNTFNNQTCKTFMSSPIFDAKLEGISPIQEGCSLTTDSIKILIVNNGIMPINGGLTASYQKLGGTAFVTENVNTTIPVGSSYLYTFNTAVDLSVTNTDSVYKIKVWITLINDNIQSNNIDTIKVSSLHTPANPVSVSSLTVPYATVATLSATSNTNTPLKWYNTAVGGNSIFTGSPYITSILFASDTFYVEANSTNPFDIIVGTGPNTSGEPFSTLNGYTTSVSIYNASEIGGYGFINQLSWDAFKGDTVNTLPVKVYVKQTSQSIMSPDTLTNLLIGATLVYDGNKMFGNTGWNSIDFTNPYYYNTGNLMVICQVNFGGTGVYPSAIFRQTSNPGSKYHQVFKADYTPSTGAGVIYASRPNIKISGYIAGCPSQRIPAIVNVGAQPAFDAGVTSIVSPITGINLSSHDTVKVMVVNYGYSTINNFLVKFKLENNTVVSELMTDTIASGSSKLFAFSQTVDLSSYVQPFTFNIMAWTDLTGDPTHQNDTIKKVIINNGPVYCVSSASITNDDDIGNVSFAGINNGNPIPVEYNPTAFQKYSNFTALSPAVVHQGSVYPISVSVIFSSFSFNGTLKVYIDFNKNGSWELPEELVFFGNYNGSNSTLSGYVAVPYNATPGFCRMRVVADENGNANPCGYYPYGETEDYTVQITPPLPHDGGISKIVTTKFLPYTASNLQTAQFFIRNYGSDTLTSATINYTVNNAAVVSHAWAGNLLTFAEDSLTQNITINTGLNSITAYTNSITSDSNQYNDTIHTSIFKEYKTTPPYLDNFETNKYWFATDTVYGMTINNLWAQGIPVSSYTSLNTAHSPVNVWITQLSDNNYPTYNYSVLYSPVFDISILHADTLSFWHWRDFNLSTTANIEYLNANGSWILLGTPNDTNAINWYNSANGWIGVDTSWLQSKYCIKNLSNLGNTVQFRFIFASGTTVNPNPKRGWAIDDFELSLAPILTDAGVTAISSPTSSSIVGDNVTITVTVKNFGASSLINIPVRYQIGSGSIQTGILAGPIASGDSANYTFVQPFQVTNIQNYEVCAYTSVINDTYTQNDKTCKNVIVNLAANDVGIFEILQPGLSVNTGNTDVKVVIKNFGTATQTTIPLSYRKGSSTAVNEIWNGNLTSGSTVEYTFSTVLNVPLGSSFGFRVYTALSNDAFRQNDTIYKNVSIMNGINDFENNKFWLGQNMPNPASNATNIGYNLPNAGEIKFDIINTYGKIVYSSIKKVNAGRHLMEINVSSFSPGIYYYSLEFDSKRLVKKMIIIQ